MYFRQIANNTLVIVIMRNFSDDVTQITQKLLNLSEIILRYTYFMR